MNDQIEHVAHISEGDVPMLDGYRYDAVGRGIHADAIQAVLDRWASISPDGDPATPLRQVNNGYLNKVDNLARMTALSVVEYLVKIGALPPIPEGSDG